MSELHIRGVRKTYGATQALKHGDLDLKPGEVHVLIGSNGSGKSTLCKIVAGSVRPDDGEVILDGTPVTVSGPEASRALGIGIFYQELSLAANRSVAENISLPALPKKGGLFVDREAVMATAKRYIEAFADVLGEGFSAETPVQALRQDQRQLVEIMKTMASEAPILIFDEPTSSLDREQVACFFKQLEILKADGRCIVFISHRMDEIFAIGDRVTVIRDGETVGSANIKDIDQSGIIAMMTGETATDKADAIPAAPVETHEAGDVVLSVGGISAAHFRDVSFDVRAGEVVGFGGLHGQGQSSVLRALFGALPRSGGSVTLRGADVDIAAPRAAIKHGIAYVSGDRGRDGIIHGRPILENVTPIHFLRNRLSLVRPSALEETAKPAMSALNTLFAGYAQPVTSLSGGNQQKVVIARWLIERPDILLLDDPTKGVDLSAKADLFALIRDLAAEGMGIVLYSSEDSELLSNADRILVFNSGSVIRELTGADRTRFNLYQAAYEAA